MIFTFTRQNIHRCFHWVISHEWDNRKYLTQLYWHIRVCLRSEAIFQEHRTSWNEEFQHPPFVRCLGKATQVFFTLFLFLLPCLTSLYLVERCLSAFLAGE